jgi:hypothetical protein
MAGYVADRRLLGQWVGVAAVVGALLGYTLAVDPVVHSAAQVAYPILWVGTSATALWLARDSLPGLAPLPVAVGTVYTTVLLWTAGLLGNPLPGVGVSVHFALPGWGPTVVYSNAVFSLTVVPFLVAGYATLGVLAASALHATLGTTAAGTLGLFACVSCTAPLLAGIAGSLGAGSVAATLSTAQYPIATAIFLLSAGGFVALARRAS